MGLFNVFGFDFCVACAFNVLKYLHLYIFS